MKDTTKAYIAGLIDGEGCIAITRRKVKRLKTGYWYYEPQVIVANTDKKMIDFLVDYYSGYVVIGQKQKEHHKQSYHWKMTGDNMRQLLRDVSPYLILKKKQANLILSFPRYSGNGHKCRTDTERQEQEDLWLAVKKLNKKGILSERHSVAR